MSFSLNAGEWNSVFAVPCSVVDNYIKLASGNSLKLLLFLLRHGGESYSDEALRNALGLHKDGELEDAALFWVQRGVIKYDNAKTTEDNNSFAPSTKKPLSSEQITLEDISPAPPKHPSSVKRVITGTEIIYSSGEISEAINNNPEIKFVFDEVDILYGRPMKDRERQNVYRLIEHYGFKPLVALMLMKYCFQIGKTTNNYILTVAQDWIDNEITTIEQADEIILAFERRNNVEEKIRRAMELKTKFTAKQREYIKTWTGEWGFDVEMVMLAYEITVNKLNEPSFPYMNSILNRWSTAGASTKEDVEALEQQHKASQKVGSGVIGSSIDVDNVLTGLLGQYTDN